MAWLSIRQAPGFVGWGEKRIKNFILKTGLSSALESPPNNNGSRRRADQSRGTLNGNGNGNGHHHHNADDGARPDVDIQNLFSVV